MVALLSTPEALRGRALMDLCRPAAVTACEVVEDPNRGLALLGRCEEGIALRLLLFGGRGVSLCDRVVSPPDAFKIPPSL